MVGFAFLIKADLLVGIGTVALIGFGAYQVLKKENPMRPGDFIMFFTYVRMLYPTVIDLMGGLAKFTRASASVDRVFEMLDIDELETTPTRQLLKPEIRGHVQFKNVGFSYGDGTHVLKDVSFKVRPGQVCAIVGASGAGKSTLVGLVPKFHDATAGRLEIDGLDILLLHHPAPALRTTQTHTHTPSAPHARSLGAFKGANYATMGPRDGMHVHIHPRV